VEAAMTTIKAMVVETRATAVNRAVATAVSRAVGSRVKDVKAIITSTRAAQVSEKDRTRVYLGAKTWGPVTVLVETNSTSSQGAVEEVATEEAPSMEGPIREDTAADRKVATAADRKVAMAADRKVATAANRVVTVVDREATTAKREVVMVVNKEATAVSKAATTTLLALHTVAVVHTVEATTISPVQHSMHHSTPAPLATKACFNML